jgi:hypothetical protein
MGKHGELKLKSPDSKKPKIVIKGDPQEYFFQEQLLNGRGAPKFEQLKNIPTGKKRRR